MSFVGHPILDEIRQGLKLRPTKTVDKSAPVILAAGEKAPTPIRGPVCNGPSAPPPPPPLGVPQQNNRPIPNGNAKNVPIASPDDRAQLLQGIRGGVRLRKVVTNDKSVPRIDVTECKPINNGTENRYDDDVINALPAVSGGGDMQHCRSSPQLMSELAQRLGGRPQNDTYESAPVTSQMTSYPPAPPPAPPLPTQSPPTQSSVPDTFYSQEEPRDDKKSDYVFDESNLYVTEDDLKKEIPTGAASVKRALFDVGTNGVNGNYHDRSPSLPLPARKHSLNSLLNPENDYKPRTTPDAAYDENNIKISEDTLRQEIPTGTAQKNIERFATPQTGQSGTLPRIRFKPNPIRSPFHEANELRRDNSVPNISKMNNNNNNNHLTTQNRSTPWASTATTSRETPTTPTPNGGVRSPSNGFNAGTFQNGHNEQPSQHQSRSPNIIDRNRNIFQTPVRSSSAMAYPLREPSSQQYATKNYEQRQIQNQPISDQMRQSISDERHSRQPVASQLQSRQPISDQMRQPISDEHQPRQPISDELRSINNQLRESINNRTREQILEQGRRETAEDVLGKRSPPSTVTYTVENGVPKQQYNTTLVPRSPPSTLNTEGPARPEWRRKAMSASPAPPLLENRPTYQPTTTVTARPVASSPSLVPITFEGSSNKQYPPLSNGRQMFRGNNQVSKPVMVRTDLLPSPGINVEPASTSPLRPLEIRESQTSPMTSSPIRTSLPYTYSKGCGTDSRTYSGQTMMQRNNEPCSPPSSQSSVSQNSPSSLSPGSSSPKNDRNKNIMPACPPSPSSLPPPRTFFVRPQFSPQQSINRSINQSSKNDQKLNTHKVYPSDAQAFKNALFSAARAKSLGPQNPEPKRVISVPISSPWHSSNYSSSGPATGMARRVVVGADELANVHPESMRGNYQFSIDLNSDTPLSITRR